ncbi:hypothetical protein 22664UKE3-2_010 [Escherichia phage vB_EcoP-22664UKE3-2]|uniref:Uncharacterized protein n=1 Tax=Escherichia phage vB_EcoP-22664UKE3-2 TaxID=2865788 RepID=A0AAE7XQL5_9CAUD|nr:hypothetical protein 22664UKE3-2_010 [Escherichia phage vB_EcoP-22664UKE3-2]
MAVVYSSDDEFWTKSLRPHLTVQELQVSPIGLFQSRPKALPQSIIRLDRWSRLQVNDRLWLWLREGR